MIISALAGQLIAKGESVDRLHAETYGFPDEIPALRSGMHRNMQPF